MAEKIEDARFRPLMLAEGFVIEKEIAEHAVAVDLPNPRREFLGRERPLLPLSIGKAKGDVVAESVVFQQIDDKNLVRLRCHQRERV